MVQVFLLKKSIEKEDWDLLISKLSKYSKIGSYFRIVVLISDSYVRFYLDVDFKLPSSLDKIDDFLFNECTLEVIKTNPKKKSILISCNNFNNLKEKLFIKRGEVLQCIDITFKKNLLRKISNKIKVITDKCTYSLFGNNPANLLTIDFSNEVNILPASPPKYLDISKDLSLLSSDFDNALFEVDTFPYVRGKFYLELNSYDFNKHSLVVGSSGSGKSKFLASLAKNILRSKANYKVVIIDPHASVDNDIGGLGKVVDFKHSSIDLFASSTDIIIINIELLLELISSLIGSPSSKAERVLRHSIYILLIDSSFNFNSLKNLILDIDYRNTLINKHKGKLPTNVIEFFASEFNDIKTKSYMEAISPIISLVDELSLLPVFNCDCYEDDLLTTITNNNLTIFSLDKTKLGDKITKTIAGLIMEQLFTLVQRRKCDEHIVFIIDEIAVVENPILKNFLSEARKYNLSLILAGQYFNQVSASLKDAIFANTLNYYIFRVSRDDAILLNKNISMKIPIFDNEDNKIKFLTDLKSRECVARLSKNGILYPPLKGRTVDLISVPRVLDDDVLKKKDKSIIGSSNTKFVINSNRTVKDILRKLSTSRKEVNK